MIDSKLLIKINNFMIQDDDVPLTQKTILLVNTGTTKKKFIIKKLSRMKLKIVVLNKEKNWAEPYVDHWILADLDNHTEALQNVKTFLQKNPKIKIDGVVTFWEDDVLLTSKIVDRFNWIGIPHEIAKKGRNKFKFREFCQANGIKAPRHVLARSIKDLKKAAKEFSFPLVIKPAYGSSSAFISKVNDPKELFETYKNISNNINISTETALTDGLDLLIEEYIDGDEVDIDVLIQNGKIKFRSISDNYDKSKGAFFVDRGQAMPSSLPEKTQEDIFELVEETLEKLGIQNGCIHYEAKTTKDGVFPIEVNLRMGGDYVYSYNKDAWQIDLIEYAVKIATGQYVKIKQKEEPYKYVIGWDLHPEDSGLLVELDIDEKLQQKKYFEDLSLQKHIGDAVLVPPEGHEYLGWLTISGENLLDAQDNLREALSYIDYKVAKFDPESSLGKTARKSSLSAAVLNKELLKQASKIEKVRRSNIKNQRNLKVGILGGASAAQEKIEKILIKLGYQIKFFNFNSPIKALNDINKSEVNLILNLSTNPLAAATLDLLRIPYTGPNAFTLNLCQDKIRMKKIMAYHQIPTPDWDYAYTLDDKIDETLEYPLMIKPGKEKIANQKGLNQKIKELIKKDSPVLVEEYIEGQEYAVFILGSEENNLKVLPIAKRGKISSKLESLISEIALDTYNILDGRDYGKVKVRLDKNNNPYILGLDPNPVLEIKNGDLLEEIIELCINRYKKKPTIVS